MIICICNNITDSEIKKKKLDGVDTVQSLLKFKQCSLQCCKCLEYLKEEINNAPTN